MVDPTLEHQSVGLSGQALCLALFAKYVGLTAYGIWAGLAEVPTFVIIGSSLFAVVWATLTATFAFLAALGVARTWATGRYRLERWTTAGFILSFVAYSFALIFRGMQTGEWAPAALSIIPLVVCVLPTIRYYSLLPRHVKGAAA